MTHGPQPDLFGSTPQGELFEDAAPASYRPDPEQVRARLRAILNEARAAKAPFPRATERLYQTIFPQMARWLPPEEADQLRFDFETELTRLKAA